MCIKCQKYTKGYCAYKGSIIISSNYSHCDDYRINGTIKHDCGCLLLGNNVVAHTGSLR